MAATPLVDLAARAATAATVGRLTEAACSVAMAVLEFWPPRAEVSVAVAAGRAVPAARRLPAMVAKVAMATRAARAATWCFKQQSAATAATSPWERAAMAATQLADLAATAATAATVGRLMAASRLVAMVATEFCLARAEISPT